MIRNHEDIIEVKPGIYGLSIDLRALYRRLFSKPRFNHVLVVAERVLQIFKEHDVSVSQIPRLISKLSLEQLSSPESLLAVLTPKIIQQIADLFQIQRKWLEGTTDNIYDCKYYCYKNPWRFFEDLKTLKIDDFDFPLIAFCSTDNLDNKSNKDQSVLLVQKEECANLDDKKIYRYRIIDQFLWGYWKSRIQLKAMINIWYKKIEIPVPIYYVDKNVLEKMESGKIVPNLYIKNSQRFRGAGLEDFCLLPQDDAVAKETEELTEVFDYIKSYQLDDMVGKNPVNSVGTAKYR